MQLRHNGLVDQSFMILSVMFWHRGVQGVHRRVQATERSPSVRAAHRTNIDGVWIRPNVARQLAVGATVRFGASTREYKARFALSGLLLLLQNASCLGVGLGSAMAAIKSTQGQTSLRVPGCRCSRCREA